MVHKHYMVTYLLCGLFFTKVLLKVATEEVSRSRCDEFNYFNFKK
jgi:hypothetical protein